MLLSPAHPTMYFIGVSTGQSSINAVFPQWAKSLSLGPAKLEGIDFKVHDSPERYRDAVSFIKQSPLALGALVTTHKIDLFEAAHDLFDTIDPLSRSMGEISSIFKRDGKLHGRTVDPDNGEKSLNCLIPKGHWQKTKATACILGAGGAGIALTWSLMQQGPDKPNHIVVSDRDPTRLRHMRHFHSDIQTDTVIDYRHCPEQMDNDALVAELAPGSLVVNATGLGKDAPGSPLSSNAVFPTNAIAWDLNYRGDLIFLDQARTRPDVRVEDGWQYFIYGWSSVIADVFDLHIPDHSPLLEELSRLAAASR